MRFRSAAGLAAIAGVAALITIRYNSVPDLVSDDTSVRAPVPMDARERAEHIARRDGRVLRFYGCAQTTVAFLRGVEEATATGMGWDEWVDPAHQADAVTVCDFLVDIPAYGRAHDERVLLPPLPGGHLEVVWAADNAEVPIPGIPR